MLDLLSLPDELLVMILSFCQTPDFLQVSQVCQKLNEITCERKLVRGLDFYFYRGLHQSHLKSFISNRFRAENVITIDLTSCYWLTSSYILNLVSHLRNVENVFVADTALLPNHLKQIMLRLTRIRRLSWTWQKGMNADGLHDALNKMQFLYLCISKSQYLNNVVTWVNKCVQLKELWINNVDTQRYSRCNIPIELDLLEKIILYPPTSSLIVKTKSNLKQYWLSDPSISKYGNERIMNIESMYVNHWREVCHVVQLSSHSIERICCSGPADSDSEKTLSMLKRLKALSIVLPEDIFPFVSQDGLFSSNFLLNKLSISAAHKYQECSTSFCEIVSTCSKLKCLSLPLQALVCASDMFESSTVGCSNRRVSRAIEALPSGVKTPFGKMVDSTPLMEVFEIGVSCENSKPNMQGNLQWDFLSLSFVGNWKFLTSLTLAYIPIIHGKFFTPMLKNCQRLQSLKIVDLGSQASCIYTLDLCNALPWCGALQDFHWTQSYVGKTSRLWTAFQQIPSLQRIALCLDGVSELEEVDVYRTMDKCGSLCFLHVATGTTKAKAKRIKQNLILRWLKTRQHLSIWFGWPGEVMESMESCPYVHAGEMLQKSSQVLGVPADSSHFLSFGERDWASHIEI